MTPTERAAVAEAIAALEPFAKDAELYSFKEDDAQSSYCFRVGQLRQAKRALASLRAVAPAPADQSDAGRDGVIERSVKAMEIAAKIIDYFYNDRTGFAGPGSPIQCIGELSYCARALASAPSETVGRGEDALAHKILGDHCACYAEAWPAETCDTERAAVAKIIRDAALSTADRDAIREALKSNGFIRGNLSVRNEASIDRRAPADQISADR